MNKFQRRVAIIASLFIILLLSAILYVRYLINNIDCIGNFTMIRDNERLSLLISKKMVNGLGIDTLSGSYTINNVTVGSIDRTVRYTYQANDGKYFITSTAILRGVHDHVDEKKLAGVLSTTYTQKNATGMLIITNQGRGGWVVSKSPIPLYFCKKRD